MRRHRALRICIVSDDFVGPIRNGGIGTAYAAMAQTLADAGHHVTVLYCEGTHSEGKPISHWVRHYAKRGITFVPLPLAPPGPPLWGTFVAKRAYAIYRWLEHTSFDVIHLHEWRGIGFYTLLAKRQGLCLQNTTVCVGVHSPTLWHREGLREFATAEDLDTDYMERETVRRADVLWSPSGYMVEWMRANGWTLPKQILVRHNIVPEESRDAASGHRAVRELCYFGRLETRKGLELFCDAIDRLVARGVRPERITFLGKSVPMATGESAAYVEARAQKWPVPFQILSNLDRVAALEYLRGDGRLAVMPSLVDNLPYTIMECLAHRVPFVSSNVGGIPEMIAAADRGRILFDTQPQALADRLAQTFAEGIAPAHFRIDPSATRRAWLAWHGAIGRRASSPPKPPRRRPLVSVCLVHHDRPQFLRRALRSIEAQTYSNIEVVLVDDGSTRPESLDALDRLESRFRARHWRIIRQPNRYLGAARNEAARQARGRYLLFMDDDNIAKPDEIATFVSAAVATKADVLTCLQDVFCNDRAPASEDDIDARCLFLGGATAPGLLRNSYGDANSLVRREVFLALGGFSEDYGLGFEDWEFFAGAALAGYHIEVIPRALFYYYKSQTGMLATTKETANRLRAMRPYMRTTPAAVRHLLHLCRADQEVAPRAPSDVTVPSKHVKKVVVFGASEGGRRALQLADRCGWRVSHFVDNNRELWNRSAFGYKVRDPETLTKHNYDLVLVASTVWRDAMFKQLDGMGLKHGSDYAYFLDGFALRDAQVKLVF